MKFLKNIGLKGLMKFNEDISDTGKVLLYYAFDVDDNILNMPTVIHMEHLVDGEWVPEDVSTARFAEVRSDSENWRILNGNPEEAFSEFRDNGPRGDNAFLMDVKEAISRGSFGPAWDDFVECLTSGALFAIITARGHEPAGMRKGIEYIVDEVLDRDQQQEMYDHLLAYLYKFKADNLDDVDRILRGRPSQDSIVKAYLDNCDLVGVSAPSRGGSPSNPEKAKEDALLEFADKANRFAGMVGLPAKIGFSDDDKKNVEHIENVAALAKELHHEKFTNIVEFVVKNTNDPSNVTKFVGKMESIKSFREFNESQDPLRASTISMRMPNAAMSGEMDSKDPYVARTVAQIKTLSELTDDDYEDETEDNEDK
jgi:hypothetical protein